MFNLKQCSMAASVAFALSGFMYGSFAIAAAGNADGSQTAAEQVKRISESIAILTAQQKEIELKAAIAEKQAALNKWTAPPLNQQALSDAANNRSMDEPHPSIRSIEGVDGKLFATLSYGGSLQQVVSQGEKIRGEWTVDKITVNAVILSRGTKKIRLVYGTEPPQSHVFAPAPVIAPATGGR